MSEFAERASTRGLRRIHFDDVGSGPTLLLVPGLGGGARTFGTLPRRFARSGLRCLTIDPIGVAPSGPLDGPFDFDAAARDLLAVLDAAGVDRCALVGTSLGGKVALSAAAHAPERVSHLVMLASSAIASARARRVYRFFELVASQLSAADFADAVAPFLFGRTFHAERAAVVDDIVRATRPTDEMRQLMVEQARALRNFDGQRHIERVRCATLCVAGLEDTLTGADEVRATAALFPAATYFEVAAAGHTLLLESGEVFDRVREFVSDTNV